MEEIIKRIALFVLAAVISFFFISPTAWTRTIIDESKNPNYLFVQTAKSGSFDGKTLTLEGVSPATVYFSDRPYRTAGHMKMHQFLGTWNKGKNSFSEDSPNATLSIFSGKEALEVVMEIANPRLQGDQLKYDVRILNGTCPGKFGVSSLFIDNFPY